MKNNRVYIVLNVLSGWKVVKDGRHVDCTKPLFLDKNLEEVKNYCAKNSFDIVRICQ